jgi:ATP-dependent Lon protease
VAFNHYNADEIHFYRRLSKAQRRSVTDFENDIYSLNDLRTPLRFRLLLSEISLPSKAVAMKKVDSLESMDGSGYQKLLQWIDALCSLPIGKYKGLPLEPGASRTEVAAFLKGMRDSLNEAVYGHEVAKGHVVRLLAQWITNPKSKGLVVGMHGPPGVGKTQMCKSVCDVLKLPFAFVPLGGANDGCFLDGHSYTYEGASWGKIADILMKTRCMNPVLFFDELDKVSDTHRGNEIVNLLIHLTDPTQNDKFNDKYFIDIDLDLSKCLVIFSYNDEAKINPVLRDRMTRIETAGYSTKDKVVISQKHLLPGILREFLLEGDAFIAEADVLQHIVESIEEEEGVRNLKRALHDIVSNINFDRLMDPESDETGKVAAITKEHVQKFVLSNEDKAKNRADKPWLTMYC